MPRPFAALRPCRLATQAGPLSLVSLALLLACSKPDHLALGRQALDKAEYQTAVIELKNAAQQSPEQADVRLALADALERSGDGLGAEHQLRQAWKISGKDDLVPRIALLMLDRMEVAKLEQEFKDRKLSTPELDSDLHAILALGHLAQRHPDKAREQLKDLKPTMTVALAQAQLLLAEGERQQALQTLQTAADKGTASWWVLRALARVQGSLNQNDQVLATLQKAMALAPWNRGLMGEYGEALLTAGRIDEATAQRDKLRKLAPGYFWTHYLNAALAARAGRFEDAHTAALKVLAVSPEHLQATLIAAAAEVQKGQTLQAEKRLLALGKQHPNSVARLELLAELYLGRNRWDEAGEAIRNGLTLAPENRRLLSLQADLALQRKDARVAAASLDALLKLAPDDAYALLRQAQLQRDKPAQALALLHKAAAATQDQALHDRIIATVLRLGDKAAARKFAEDIVKARPELPATRLSLAAVLRAEGKVDAARKEVLAVLDKQPAYAPALAALDLISEAPAQRDEVLQRYAEASKSKGGDAQIVLAYARQLQAAGKAEPSPLSVLEQGVSQFPEDVRLRSELVEAYMIAGKPDKAISVAESGANANNAPARAIALVASTYQRLGKDSSALEAWRKAVAASPLQHDWKLQLVELELAAQRKNEAISLLRSLLTSHPDDPQAYVRLAQLMLKDKPAEALSVAQQMSARETLHLDGLLLQGELLARQGKSDEALKQYSEAAKAGAMPQAALARVGVLDRAKREAAGDAELAALLRSQPNNATVLAFAAERALSAGQQAQSMDYWKRAIAAAPKDGTLLNDYAWALVRTRQPGAVEIAVQAVRLTGGHANALDTLGMAQAQAGKTEEAIASLRQAVRQAPTVALPRLHLAELLQGRGDAQGAAELLKDIRSQQLAPSDLLTLKKLRGGA